MIFPIRESSPNIVRYVLSLLRWQADSCKPPPQKSFMAILFGPCFLLVSGSTQPCSMAGWMRFGLLYHPSSLSLTFIYVSYLTSYDKVFWFWKQIITIIVHILVTCIQDWSSTRPRWCRKWLLCLLSIRCSHYIYMVITSYIYIDYTWAYIHTVIFISPKS